jgi:DNA-binding transcriptional regulator YiaG
MKKIKTKLTQKEIAEEIGVTQPTVHNWLNLSHKPKGIGAAILAEKFPEINKQIKEYWDGK